MNSTVLSAIPEEELRRLERSIGRTCKAIRFCLMRDADAQYEGVDPSGLYELTWGVLVDLHDAPSLCVTWTQDALGNPNRLSLVEPAAVLAVESVRVHDVSSYAPWAAAIGQGCHNVIPHTYRSNYGRRPAQHTWHDVLWGLQFDFTDLSFLVAAALHGHSDSNPTANDELVVAYTPTSVARLVALRAGYEEAWSGG